MTSRRTSEKGISGTVKRTRRLSRKQSSRAGVQLIATTISFTAPNVISDSGNNFTAANGWLEGQNIEVNGSDLNAGKYTIEVRADGLLTVRPQSIGTEAAGATIVIRQGH